MIYNLIGSGILVAVGAAGMWAVMQFRLATSRRFFQERRADDRADIRYYRDTSKNVLAALDEAYATNDRLSDTVGQLQYKRDKTLEYCKQFRVRGAVVAEMLRGDRA